MSKEKIVGYTGSVIFCGLLLLLLCFIFVYAKIEAREEGVLVNFGNVDWAAGTVEPRPERSKPLVENTENTNPQTPSAKPNPEPPAITQNTEQTVAIDVAEREKKRQEERQRQEQERERQRREAEQQRIRDINDKAQSNFGGAGTGTGSEGTAATGTGNQGSSQGNAPVGSYVGVGGYGGFDLAGRTLGAGGLPRPTYSAQEEGKIVINITVSPQGTVISAEIGRGTNITTGTMRNSALEAARKTRFNSITENNNQSGTITYNYKLN